MKLSQITIFLLLVFVLLSCRESFVKTKESLPVKGVPEPNEKVNDTTNLFKKNLEEKEKTKFKKDLDTLKPKLAWNLDSISSPVLKSKIH